MCSQYFGKLNYRIFPNSNIFLYIHSLFFQIWSKKLRLKLSEVFYGIEIILCIIFFGIFLPFQFWFWEYPTTSLSWYYHLIYSIEILIIIVFDILIINIWYFVKRVKSKFDTNIFDAKMIFALHAQRMKKVIKH